MISKRHLLAMICDLTTEIEVLYERVGELEDAIEKNKTPAKKEPSKRKPGRPRKQK